MYQHLSSSTPVARKVHSCCECNCPINIGVKYSRDNYLWDGDFNTGAAHIECQEAGGANFDFLDTGDGGRYYIADGMDNWGFLSAEVGYFLEGLRTEYPVVYARLNGDKRIADRDAELSRLKAAREI